MANEAIKRKISLLTNKIEFREKLDRRYVWRLVLSGSETWLIRKLERKYLENFEICCWKRLGKIKMSDKVANEKVIELIFETMKLINN